MMRTIFEPGTGKVKTKYIPLFPLQVVVFPGELLKLHIFEPRYRQLIAECEISGITFGIPAYIDGGVAEFGTVMRLVEVLERYPSGELDIVTEGIAAFRLKRFLRAAPEKLYPAGEVEVLSNVSEAPAVLTTELWTHFHRLHELLKTGHRRELRAHENLSFLLGQETGLNMLQRLQLLSMPRERDREQFLLEHLHRLIPTLEATEETKKHVGGNGRVNKFPELKF